MKGGRIFGKVIQRTLAKARLSEESHLTEPQVGTWQEWHTEESGSSLSKEQSPSRITSVAKLGFPT